MHPLNIKLWKFISTSGLFSLLLGTILMLIVIHKLLPYLQSRKTQSLRDQHQDPVSRLGGVAMAFSFWLTLALLIWLPFDTRGMGVESLPLDRMTGLLLGSLLAWGLGFVDDLRNIRARWKLVGQIGLGALAVSFGFSIQTDNPVIFDR